MKRLIPVLLIALLATACSDSEQFRVNGTIEGKPTLNLRVGYYVDGVGYRTIVTAAREGEFEFFGSAKSPSLVEIMDYDYRPIARLYAVNGQTYELKIARDNPFDIEITGSEINEEWSRFLRENSDSLRAGYRSANAAVARYIAAHPDRLCSTLLLLTSYDSSIDPYEADSLLSMISPQARPGALTEGYTASLQRVLALVDSTEVLPIPYYQRRNVYSHLKPSDKAYTLICFTDRGSRPEVLPARLRRLSGLASSRLAIADLSLDPDTSEWRSSIRTDSATWAQGWAAAGISSIGVDRLAIPSLPFFIVCDSAGNQIYRGPVLERAVRTAEKLIKE